MRLELSAECLVSLIAGVNTKAVSTWVHTSCAMAREGAAQGRAPPPPFTLPGTASRQEHH